MNWHRRAALTVFWASSWLLVCPRADGASEVGRATHSASATLIPHATPNMQNCSHYSGKLWMTATNWGYFGKPFQFAQLAGQGCLVPGSDPYAYGPSAEYPGGSKIDYLFLGALWIGAIVDGDTLVSVGQDGWQAISELYPKETPYGSMVRLSNDPSDPDYDPTAVSSAELCAEYTDTLVDNTWTSWDPFDGRPHAPIGLRISQQSYSWSQEPYEDFVIFRFRVTNISCQQIEKVCIGLYFDTDVFHPGAYNGFLDDITGSYLIDDPVGGHQVLTAWAADADGDPTLTGQWDSRSPRGVLGVSLLDLPTAAQQSFNWWVCDARPNFDWGPRYSVNDRDFGTGGIGTPAGDRNKYYVMSTAERDYDQIWTEVDHTSQGWLPPGMSIPLSYADGSDTRFLLSFGTIDLAPSDSMEFAFVVAVGDNFHRNPRDFQNLFNPNDPQAFYDSLDFSDLTTNILTARELYRQLFVIIPGDANRNGVVDVVDAIYLVNYIFIGGPEPSPHGAGDANGDCSINIADAVVLVNYIFRNGDAPRRGCSLLDCGQLADQWWSRELYTNWLIETYGIVSDTMEYIDSQGQPTRFNYHLPLSNTNDFYEMIGEYDQFRYGWKDTNYSTGDSSSVYRMQYMECRGRN